MLGRKFAYPFLMSSIQADRFFSLQEIFGGNATSDEYHIGRHVANLFVTQTYEGQSDIHGKLDLLLGPERNDADIAYSAHSRPCDDRHPSVRLIVCKMYTLRKSCSKC